jgi:hypothetical protein
MAIGTGHGKNITINILKVIASAVLFLSSVFESMLQWLHS